MAKIYWKELRRFLAQPKPNRILSNSALNWLKNVNLKLIQNKMLYLYILPIKTQD